MPRRAAGARKGSEPVLPSPALFCVFGEGRTAAVRASAPGAEGPRRGAVLRPGRAAFVQRLLCLLWGTTGAAEAVGVQALPGLPNRGLLGCLCRSETGCVTSEDTGVGRSGDSRNSCAEPTEAKSLVGRLFGVRLPTVPGNEVLCS